MSRPKKIPPQVEKTEIQKDMEREWRKLSLARKGNKEF
jgi:hypothetical protein